MPAHRNEAFGNEPFRFTFPAFNGAVFEDPTVAFKAWLQCVMAMNTETGKFVAHRLQRDVQLPLTIVQCHTPQDVMQTQIEFYRTMAEDYASHANHLGRIVSESFHSIDRPETLAWPQPKAVEEEKHRRAA